MSLSFKHNQVYIYSNIDNLKKLFAFLRIYSLIRVENS